jgi:hypothetical protein
VVDLTAKIYCNAGIICIATRSAISKINAHDFGVWSGFTLRSRATTSANNIVLQFLVANSGVSDGGNNDVISRWPHVIHAIPIERAGQWRFPENIVAQIAHISVTKTRIVGVTSLNARNFPQISALHCDGKKFAILISTRTLTNFHVTELFHAISLKIERQSCMNTVQSCRKKGEIVAIPIEMGSETGIDVIIDANACS